MQCHCEPPQAAWQSPLKITPVHSLLESCLSTSQMDELAEVFGIVEGGVGYPAFARVVMQHRDGQHQPGRRGLPGIRIARGDYDPVNGYRGDHLDGTIFVKGFIQIEAAMLTQVFTELAQNFIEQVAALPGKVVTIAGLMGRIGGRQVVPGLAGAEFPEDAVQNGTPLAWRAAAAWRGKTGRRGATTCHCSSVRSIGFLSKKF